MQSALSTQPTQAPELMSHTLLVLAEQSTLVTQPRHMRLVGSQTGVSPEQSALVAHPGMQVPLVVLQTSGDGHWAVDAHWTHSPAVTPVVEQVGVGEKQSVAWHARHVFENASQMGVAPEQFAFVAHAAQRPVAVAQNGVGATHATWFVDEHCPQAPDGWHALPLALPEQSESAVQAWQVLPMHAGRFGFVQSAPVVHALLAPETSQSSLELSKRPCTEYWTPP